MNRTAYKNQFNADHYERINFSVPKGMKQVIKDLAADKGMSMNKYFLFLVNKDQEGLFDNMQLAEKSREKGRKVQGKGEANSGTFQGAACDIAEVDFYCG